MSVTISLVLVGVLTVVSMVLAAAETGLTHMSRARAEALAADEVRGAGRLLGLLERRESVLNPVLLLLLVCHLGSATILATMVQTHWGADWVIVAFAAQVVVYFTLAEAVPKIWALDDDRVVTLLAPAIGALDRIAPLRWITQGFIAVANLLLPSGVRGEPAVSEDEFLAFASAAVEADAIDLGEQELIEKILSLDDTVAREVMVPRPDMVTIDRSATVAEAVDEVIDHGFSRVPVTGDDIDDVIGVVHSKDLMRANRSGRGGDGVVRVMRRARFCPETKNAAELMRDMQAGQYHQVVAIDEYGGTAGLVTLEDIVEEIFGEIVDEFDSEEPLATALATGELRVHGRMPVDEVNRMLDTELPDGDWDTIGGLLFNTLGHVPELGESIDTARHRFLVEAIEGRRITLVRISVLPDDEIDAGADGDATPDGDADGDAAR